MLFQALFNSTVELKTWPRCRARKSNIENSVGDTFIEAPSSVIKCLSGSTRKGPSSTTREVSTAPLLARADKRADGIAVLKT